MPADIQQARDRFLHAVGKLPPGEWDGYIREACGGDGELEQQVAELLRVHCEAGSFLDRPAAAVTPTEVFTPEPGDAASLPLREGPGTVIGPYKLLQQIGEGGMGTVFMAEQTHPVRRKVALKVIKAGMDSRQVISRFEAERQALAVMDHVSIARVFDGGTTDAGRPYFVMELVHGVPITKYCDDNHLTPRERLELFIPVCQAIQHAHQKGIIHRDIKPSNVMITLYDGKPVPKVIDFGVAKAIEQKLTERTLFTQYGALVGTLEYMSPEQAEMSALGVDTRSDIYSLGVLLYELLTGTTPLSHKRVREAAYAEILRLIKEEEPPRPSTRLSDSGTTLATISAQRRTEPTKLSKLMRGELDWIVLKTLEKDRTRRYATANGLAADVQHYLCDETVQACPPSASYRLRKFARRNKRGLVTATVLAVALLTGTGISAWQAVRATNAEGLAQTRLQAETEAQNATQAQLLLTQQAQEKATLRLFDARLAQAKAGRTSRLPGQRYDSLKAIEDAVRIARELNLSKERFDELRNEEIACLVVPDVRFGPIWNTTAPESATLVFDGDYQRYAWANEQGIITVRRVADDHQIARLAGFGLPIRSLLFSRDGQFLAVHAGDGRMQVWHVEREQAILPESSPGGAWGFSPDNRQIAIGRPDGTINLYDLPTGKETKRLRGASVLAAIAFDPSSQRLAVCYQPVTAPVQVWDLTSGTVLSEWVLPTARVLDLSWHPDGQHLALGLGTPANRAEVWDVAARRPVATMEGHGQDVTALCFHPSGSLLCTGSWDGTARLWDAATGRQVLLWVNGFHVRFSQDGTRLGYTRDGSKVQLVEVAAPQEYRTLVSRLGAGQGEYRDGAISPDGRLLAVAMDDGVRLWNPAGGGELDFLPLGRTWSVCFQADGRELLTVSESGIRRWPLRNEGGTPGVVRIGPPQTVPLSVVPARAVRSPDGRTIVVASAASGAAVVVDLPGGAVRFSLAHPNFSDVALSPDGHWVATSGWHASSVRIWNAQTGAMVKELQLGPQSKVFFTSDSQSLVTCRSEGYCFWEVGTWQPGRRLHRKNAPYPGHLAFSHDRKVLALELSSGIIDLVNAQSGKTLTRLEDPNRDRPTWMGFTPDGTRLVTIAAYSKAIHIWDLRRIRERLVEMDLDIEREPYPPPNARDAVTPLRVQVDQGDCSLAPETPNETVLKYGLALASMPLNPQSYLRRGRAHYQLKQWREAADDLGTALAMNPGHMDEQVWFELGYASSMCGRIEPALAAYTRSLELGSRNPLAWNNRGQIHIRQSKWDKAIGDYSRAVELKPDLWQAWYGRGLGHAGSGQWEKAVADYSRAIGLKPDLRDAYDRRRNLYVTLGQWDKIITECAQTIEVNPGHAGSYNSLAWLLATCPDTKFRDPKRAVELGQKAATLAPEDGDCQITLGVAQYRAGDWKAASAALQKAMPLRKGGDCADWFFLAMVHWRLGDTAEARKWYDKADQWMKTHHHPDWPDLRAEAAELLSAKQE
jgi:serine/threonine protein kinase/WD40 repeat protein/Flp pilus assembly protein TadD